VIAKLSLTALAGLIWAWYGWLQPAAHIGLVLLAALPISCFLPWIWLGSRKALLGAALFSVIYFVHGTTELIANPEARGLATLELALCTLLYISLSLKSKRRNQ